MKISTKGRYAVRLMYDLAAQNGEEATALRDVAARQEISQKYLEQIVNQLTVSGLVRSVRGPKGGYHLVKKPEEYTIGEILRITEGSLAPVACLEDAKNQCERYERCATVGLWEGAYRVITAYFDGITLQDLLEGKTFS